MTINDMLLHCDEANASASCRVDVIIRGRGQDATKHISRRRRLDLLLVKRVFAQRWDVGEDR